MEKISPKMVRIKASFFRIKEIVIKGFVRIKEEIIHPEKIVPRASRFKALERLGSSSLVGERGVKEGALRKQKYIIRIEYTEVRSVAKKERVIPKKFERLESLISRIRSFE